MLKKYILIFFTAINSQTDCIWTEQIKHFPVTPEPIDVVITCHAKDICALDTCIKSVRTFVADVRRIIVVSQAKFTDQAEWFDESLFPFGKQQIMAEFASIDPNYYQNKAKVDRVGWYFKQIMNFYAAFIIPGISSNILILDADIFFKKPVAFIDAQGTMLHAPGTENHVCYFEHMDRFLPGLKRVIPQYSGISHHMLFQRSILQDLFNLVESYHKMPFWKAYCRCVDPAVIAFSGAADYEIYFNFVLQRTKQIKIRPLTWANVQSMQAVQDLNSDAYDFVSCHSYARV